MDKTNGQASQQPEKELRTLILFSLDRLSPLCLAEEGEEKEAIVLIGFFFLGGGG